MAVAMSSATAAAQDADLMDIDIDMDMDDNGTGADSEFQLEEGEEPSFVPTGASIADNTNVIPAIYTEDPALEPQWTKIHIRGVDEFHTNDILAFANDNFPEAGEDVHIQWIDDTSANIVYKTAEMARKAILAFVAAPTNEQAIQEAPFEVRSAKQLTSRPASMLMVRIAQQGDRKRKNARDASRYYLLHPDQDPTERMRREFANGKAQRGESGEYRRRRFDDREHRRRRDQDQNGNGTDFAASMYDDAPATDPENNDERRGRDLFSRMSRGRRRSASPGTAFTNDDEIDISGSDDDGRLRRRRDGYRDRSDRPPPYSRRDPNPVPHSNVGKELFNDSGVSNSGRKEGNLHSDKLELFPSPSLTSGPRPSSAADRAANTAAAKRLKADLLSASQTSPRSNHRRSHAMDAKNEEDLSERFARKSISIDSTKSMKNGNAGLELFPPNDNGMSSQGIGGEPASGFSIKGSGGMSIKGRAEVKELFPGQYSRQEASVSRNAGKELFDEPIREKRIRRRAGDLFD